VEKKLPEIWLTKKEKLSNIFNVLSNILSKCFKYKNNVILNNMMKIIKFVKKKKKKNCPTHHPDLFLIIKKNFF